MYKKWLKKFGKLRNIYRIAIERCKVMWYTLCNVISDKTKSRLSFFDNRDWIDRSERYEYDSAGEQYGTVKVPAHTRTQGT